MLQGDGLAIFATVDAHSGRPASSVVTRDVTPGSTCTAIEGRGEGQTENPMSRLGRVNRNPPPQALRLVSVHRDRTSDFCRVNSDQANTPTWGNSQLGL